jgi:ABC-type Fe3+-hydroxamate transport system substrate-binding protein
MILDKSVPVCGDQSGLDYERLLAAHPTHILMQWSEREIPSTLKTIAAERNWKLINAPTLTLDDIRRTVKQLAAEFAAADLETRHPKTDLTATDPRVLSAYLRIEDRLAKAWPTDSKPAGPRVLMLESLDPPAALGPGSFHHELLLAVGGQPAITSGKPYVTLDAEDVLRMAPEAIIIFAPRPYGSAPRPELSRAELLALLNRLGTLNIPAIRHDRIALIDDPLCLLPSTAMVDLADELRRRLAAWKQP